MSEGDGRHQRREANRRAVLDALAALHVEGHYEPSTNEIAERAGLSPRSLFRYFDDVDDLHHAAIEQQLVAARPLLEVKAGPDDTLDVRITELVAARARLFEATAPAARATRACAHRAPVVAAQLRDGRSYLRHQVDRFLGPDLDPSLLPAADALLSFETWELLRHDRRLSRARTVAALEASLTALTATAAVPQRRSTGAPR